MLKRKLYLKVATLEIVDHVLNDFPEIAWIYKFPNGRLTVGFATLSGLKAIYNWGHSIYNWGIPLPTYYY